MYWIAKEELPNCKFDSLIKLLKLLKLPDIEHFDHKSGGSVQDVSYVWRDSKRASSLESRQG